MEKAVLMPLPTGTITLLFTDIEGSTQLWERFPEAMRLALARHDHLLRTAIESHGGVVFKTVGDAFCAAFPTASAGIRAALEAQLSLLREAWQETGPIRVRMALHTGETEERDSDYFGPTVNRVARLQSLGHGGQTLLSQATFERLEEGEALAGAALQDRGLHRLKDLLAPEHVYQLLHPALPSDFPPLRSLDYLPTNLPQQLTSFIGRGKEKAEVKERLSHSRLLTLTGSGGTGKTRLALQVGAETLEDFPDGVWLVELAALSDPDLVAQAVATALHLRGEPGRPLSETLTDHLRDKTLLLLLDNCEHLLDSCARLANTLLTHCARVRILATSREPLGIAGESAYRIPSLSMPNPKQSLPGEDLHRYEAVQLFLERAVSQQPAFTLNERNASTVASVCRRLDGIPLAIELATARMRAMPVEQIEPRLNDRFRLLTGGSRTALPRQQTLRALMDWSYDMLNDQEKTLLHRLSVFAGGWTLEAADAVCARDEIESWELLDLLLSLSDKSLVVYEEAEGSARYRLLETLRQYALEKLAIDAGAKPIQDRHRDYFLSLAENAAPNLDGAEQGAWLEILETEHENLRAALDWCAQDAEGAEKGLRMGAALQRFWATRGYFTEGRERLSALLARPEAQQQTLVRADALHGAGLLAFYQSDYDAAQSLLEASLAIRQERGEGAGAAHSLLNLGNVAYRRGDFAAADSLYERSCAIRSELNDRQGMAAALSNRGSVASSLRDYAKARSLLEQSVAIKEELGDPRGIAIALDNLGSVATLQGDYEAARPLHERSLVLQRQLGNREGIATVLGHLASLAYWQADYSQAYTLFEQSLEIHREIGDQGGLASALANLGSVASKQGDYAAARSLHAQSLTIERRIGSPQSVAISLINLSGAAREQGEFSTARDYLHEAITLLQNPGDRSLLEQALEALATLA
jgi:predicted ATPase/class 3 adenylate cyclase/Tfp pilus assembly protein PilF